MLKPTSPSLEPTTRRRISFSIQPWLLSTDLNARYGLSKQTDSSRTCLCNFLIVYPMFLRGEKAAFQPRVLRKLPPFEGCEGLGQIRLTRLFSCPQFPVLATGNVQVEIMNIPRRFPAFSIQICVSIENNIELNINQLPIQGRNVCVNC